MFFQNKKKDLLVMKVSSYVFQIGIFDLSGLENEIEYKRHYWPEKTRI